MSILSFAKHSRYTLPRFWVGLAGIFLGSLALRFWGLDRFNTLVFDEVYYARFASAFLQHRLTFEGHPPLSTYLIAAGIWVAHQVPGLDEGIRNGFSGLFITPFSYRWLNALTGSFIPLVLAGVAYQLTRRYRYALIAALLIAADGLFLVESRYALNNVYLVLFGLLGHWFFLMGINAKGRSRPSGRSNSFTHHLYLLLSGIGFGAAAAIKWNGLGFLLGAYAVWAVAWFGRGLAAWQQRSLLPDIQHHPPLLQKLASLHPGLMAVYLAAIPALFYRLSWIPYLRLSPGTSFWDWQENILAYHQRVGGPEAHAYCSAWYSWLLMARPVAYFYKTTHGLDEPPAIAGPPLPRANVALIYDVHAMGNPILWWLSTAAILVMLVMLVQRSRQWLTQRNQSPMDAAAIRPQSGATLGVVLYLVLNWGANLLPWVSVSRCTFIYHYMGALVFALLAIALLIDRWLRSPNPTYRAVGLTAIAFVLAGFIFWMPLFLGLPLSPKAIALRFWFRSWA